MQQRAIGMTGMPPNPNPPAPPGQAVHCSKRLESILRSRFAAEGNGLLEMYKHAASVHHMPEQATNAVRSGSRGW